MNMMRVGLLAATAMLAGGQAMAFEWSDTQLRYWYGPNFREPGINGDIAKNILSLTHADGYAWGGNFLNVDILKSDNHDPASNSRDGALEVYVVYRTDLSLGKVADGKPLPLGPFRDVMFEAGFDANTKDTTFDSEKRMPVAGIAGIIDVPAFWKVSLLWDKEFGHNGVVGKSISYNGTARLETAWDVSFDLASQPMDFEGFGCVNGPKGKDGFGAQTVTEILIHPKLMADIGADFGDPGHYKLGFGYEYWLNKFGNDHTRVPGAEANAVFVEADYHF